MYVYKYISIVEYIIHDKHKYIQYTTYIHMHMCIYDIYEQYIYIYNVYMESIYTHIESCCSPSVICSRYMIHIYIMAVAAFRIRASFPGPFSYLASSPFSGVWESDIQGYSTYWDSSQKAMAGVGSSLPKEWTPQQGPDVASSPWVLPSSWKRELAPFQLRARAGLLRWRVYPGCGGGGGAGV